MKNAIEIIKYFEGCKLQSYLCPSNIWTIGYGHTKNVYPGMTITEEQAEKLFNQDINDVIKTDPEVYNFLNKLDVNEKEAIISFIFNVGIYQFKESSVYRHLKNNNKIEVCNSLIKYVKSFNKVELGLKRRRLTECALFMDDTNFDDFYHFKTLNFNDLKSINNLDYFDIVINRLVSLNYIYDIKRANLVNVVKKFQQDNNLIADGYLGIKTSLALIINSEYVKK